MNTANNNTENFLNPWIYTERYVKTTEEIASKNAALTRILTFLYCCNRINLLK